MELFDGARAADVGCGAGRELELILERVGERGTVFGVDTDRAMLDVAAERVADITQISVVEADAADLPWADGTVDGLRAERLVQHLTSPIQALREFERVLRSGSRAVIVECAFALEGDLVNAPQIATSPVGLPWGSRPGETGVHDLLPVLLRRAGYQAVELEIERELVDSPEELGWLLGLGRSGHAGIHLLGGAAPVEEVREWLHERTSAGSLRADLAMIVASGRAK
jgi:SAM-dependent methyltransferase